jgi:hypothetical protein
MTALRVIGIDPGPQPGLVLLRFGISTPWWPCSVRAIQCDAAGAPEILNLLLNDASENTRTLVGCERFVRSSRSARLRHGGAASKTERMITEFQNVYAGWRLGLVDMTHTQWLMNNASRVKRWAVYERLDKAGLLDATVGMTHARDAAREALFTACHDGGAPDPLSRKASP